MLASALAAAATLAVTSSRALASGAQEVTGTKLRTRLVIGLDKLVEPRVFALANPSRVIVDLPDVAVGLPSLPAGEAVGLVRSIRGGLAAADRYRVILEVTEPVVIERSIVETAKDGKGKRLVVELVPVDGAAGGARPATPAAGAEPKPTRAAVVQPPSPKRAERPEARAKRSARPIIVLDPGHGGMDSGAVRNGAVEKDVVLAFSLVLRDLLNGTGRYRVLMTRDTDKFIPLDERREFAEENDAALFMAIHADSANASASGATVYSLREGVAESLKHSARREVVNSVLKDRQLRDLKDGNAEVVRSMLGGLAEKDVLANPSKTSVFARSLIDYMSASTTMMSNPDRQAAFRVLQTAKVPAVLVELAFVSNRQDAQKLMSDAWRTKVAESLVTAIEAYFANPASSPLR